MEKINKKNKIVTDILKILEIIKQADTHYAQFITDIKSFSEELNEFYSLEEKKCRVRFRTSRSRAEKINIELEKILKIIESIYYIRLFISIENTPESFKLYKKSSKLIELSIAELNKKETQLYENLSNAKKIYEEEKKSYSYGIAESKKTNENEQYSHPMLPRK